MSAIYQELRLGVGLQLVEQVDALFEYRRAQAPSFSVIDLTRSADLAKNSDKLALKMRGMCTYVGDG